MYAHYLSSLFPSSLSVCRMTKLLKSLTTLANVSIETRQTLTYTERAFFSSLNRHRHRFIYLLLSLKKAPLIRILSIKNHWTNFLANIRFHCLFTRTKAPPRGGPRTRLVTRWRTNLIFSLRKTTHKQVSKNIRFRFSFRTGRKLLSCDSSHIRFLLRRFREPCSPHQNTLSDELSQTTD